MQHLSRSQRVYVLDSETAPAITVDSGEELMVETWDAFEGVRDPIAVSATELKGGATGPIHVNGAEPGDALKIEFLSITPKEGAVHMVMPGRGFLDDEFTQGYATVIEFQDGHAVLPTGVRLPLAPSMGLVATTPTYRQSTASDSGPYGGDIDMKELVAGSTLYLPVFVPGGMLCLGDCHAVVGDGRSSGHRCGVLGGQPDSDHRRKAIGSHWPTCPYPSTLRRAVPRRGLGRGHAAGGAGHGGLPGAGEGY